MTNDSSCNYLEKVVIIVIPNEMINLMDIDYYLKCYNKISLIIAVNFMEDGNV